MNIDDLTQAEREIAYAIDELIQKFVKVALPPGTEFVMLVGSDAHLGALFSNVEHERIIAFLSRALETYRQ